MAETKSDLDANEPATPRKLDEAHERGTIFRSTELTFAVVLLVSVACIYGLAAHVIDGTAMMLRRGLSFAGRDELNSASALAYSKVLVSYTLTVLGPVIFAVWIAALAVGALQARGVFSAQPRWQLGPARR